MSSKGWFNLEAVGGTIPETQFFEGDSAFSSLGLTRTQRLYGFVARYVVVVAPSSLYPVSFLLLSLSVALGSLAVLLVSGHLNLLFDSYIVGMVLSILGTVMLIIGGLGSFAGAYPMSFLSLSGLFSKCLGSWPSTLFVNSTLRHRDRNLPYRNRILDWGTSGYFFLTLMLSKF